MLYETEAPIRDRVDSAVTHSSRTDTGSVVPPADLRPNHWKEWGLALVRLRIPLTQSLTYGSFRPIFLINYTCGGSPTVFAVFLNQQPHGPIHIGIAGEYGAPKQKCLNSRNIATAMFSTQTGAMEHR